MPARLETGHLSVSVNNLVMIREHKAHSVQLLAVKCKIWSFLEEPNHGAIFPTFLERFALKRKIWSGLWS